MSVTTVSRALTGPARQKIDARTGVARNSFYRPNRGQASSPEDQEYRRGSGPRILSIRHLARRTRAHQTGYAVLLADSEDPAAEASLVHDGRGVDGVIICSPFAADASSRSGGGDVARLINRALPAAAALMDSASGAQLVVHLQDRSSPLRLLGGRAMPGRPGRLRGLRAAVKPPAWN